MISLSEKEKFLNNFQKLKGESGIASKFIIHDLGHCFDIKNKFESKHEFMLNLFEMDKFYKSLSVEERNQSEKNALAYEITLCNLLQREPDNDIKTFINNNYNFQDNIIINNYQDILNNKISTFFDPHDNEIRRERIFQMEVRQNKVSQIYNEICSMVENLSFFEQEKLFLFAKDIIFKWAKQSFRPNEMFYNDNYDEEYYNDNQIAEIGGRL